MRKSDLVGRSVDKRLKVIRHFAEGGEADVYEAKSANGTRIALKVLAPNASAELRERFKHSSELSLRLSTPGHPNIVPVLGWGEEPDIGLYLEMPFISAETFESRLRRGRVPVPETVRTLRQVTDGVAYLHKHDVLWKDAKPLNVLSDGEHAWITDLGVARDMNGAFTQTFTTFRGTPAYAAPECFGECPVGPTADVYSVGVMLHRALSGKAPFLVPSVERAIYAIFNEPLPALADELSAFDAVVRRATAKAPADRPQSIEEFKWELLDAAFTWQKSGSREPAADKVSAPVQRSVWPVYSGNKVDSASATATQWLKTALEAAEPSVRLACPELGTVVVPPQGLAVPAKALKRESSNEPSPSRDVEGRLPQATTFERSGVSTGNAQPMVGAALIDDPVEMAHPPCSPQAASAGYGKPAQRNANGSASDVRHETNRARASELARDASSHLNHVAQIVLARTAPAEVGCGADDRHFDDFDSLDAGGGATRATLTENEGPRGNLCSLVASLEHQAVYQGTRVVPPKTPQGGIRLSSLRQSGSKVGTAKRMDEPNRKVEAERGYRQVSANADVVHSGKANSRAFGGQGSAAARLIQPNHYDDLDWLLAGPSTNSGGLGISAHTASDSFRGMLRDFVDSAHTFVRDCQSDDLRRWSLGMLMGATTTAIGFGLAAVLL